MLHVLENNFAKQRTIKNATNMKPSFLISENVVKAVKELPATERDAVARALLNELFSDTDPTEGLSPFEHLIYTMISSNMHRDTERFCSRMPAC